MTENMASTKIRRGAIPPFAAMRKVRRMPKRGRHGPYKIGPKAKRLRRPIFLRQWRIYRNLTQEQLAERTHLSIGTISGLENGTVGYSDESLNILADALNCDPGHILMVDPSKPDAIW